ncbi:MAG TPA: hypothetical protein DCS13_02270 [Candidatus Margulisbacteria bacterium]|nr:hypothetical protein [Candidatus Margulisiibacteriota bacterium]
MGEVKKKECLRIEKRWHIDKWEKENRTVKIGTSKLRKTTILDTEKQMHYTIRKGGVTGKKRWVR